jgi:kynureninase
LGFAPLYTRFIDVYEGMRRLRSVIETGAYHSFGADRSRVT